MRGISQYDAGYIQGLKAAEVIANIQIRSAVSLHQGDAEGQLRKVYKHLEREIDRKLANAPG